jgi:hypothetical protein
MLLVLQTKEEATTAAPRVAHSFTYVASAHIIDDADDVRRNLFFVQSWHR